MIHFNHKLKKRLINGRTMTEMIATLSIMGILSILVIRGYRYAWNTNTANDVISTVSQMAVTASTQLEKHNTISLYEFGDKIIGHYPYAANATYGDGLFSIKLEDVPYGVCNRIQSYGWDVPKVIKYADVENGDCAEDTGTIEFVFQRTLEKK